MAFLSTYWPILALAYVGVLVFIVRAFMAWSGADHRTDSDLERQVADLRRLAANDEQSRSLPLNVFCLLHSNSNATKDHRNNG